MNWRKFFKKRLIDNLQDVFLRSININLSKKEENARY